MSCVSCTNSSQTDKSYEATSLKATPSKAGGSAEIINRIKKATLGFFFVPERELKDKFKGMSAVELSNVLKSFCDDLIQNSKVEDFKKVLDRLATLIPLDKLEGALHGSAEDIFSEAKDMTEAAKYYIQTTQGPAFQFKAAFSTALDSIISVFETILTTFGIGDLFKPSESEIHSEIKSQRMMMLMSLFQMIVGVVALVEVPAIGVYIGAAFLVIGALSLLWPFIKPAPHSLPGDAVNWTRQIQKKGCIAQGRQESLEQIADILKMNRHTILVGPSRVGKTLTAMAFAQAVERGDYPELKGKKVFYINTTALIGERNGPSVFTGGSVLKRISDAMGVNRKDIILVLDEIHNACKENSKAADQLKTYIDEGGDFPHVIGITTDEEYESYVKKNTAFSLRFDPVKIQNTSEDETLKILSDTLLQSSVKPLLEENSDSMHSEAPHKSKKIKAAASRNISANSITLDMDATLPACERLLTADPLLYLYLKSSEDLSAPQPATARKILKKCINKTGKTQRSHTEKQITKISAKILSLRAQAVAHRGRKKGLNTEIHKLEEQLNKLQQALEKEKVELKSLFKSKDLLDSVISETYHTVLKISAVSKKALTPEEKHQLKLFLLLKDYLGRSLEDHVKSKSQKLGIRMSIDTKLIDEMIQEEKAAKV